MGEKPAKGEQEGEFDRAFLLFPPRDSSYFVFSTILVFGGFGVFFFFISFFGVRGYILFPAAKYHVSIFFKLLEEVPKTQDQNLNLF